MNSFLFVLLCSSIIFLCTSIGSLFVYLVNKINSKTENICLGLAGGIMLASSIWSLLTPAISTSKYFIILIGFILGVFIITKLDKLVDKYSNNKKNTMLFAAMTIHNIPEGMTVGLISSYAYKINSGITISAALALTIGIAIQNIPEGAAISLNYRQQGLSKFKSTLLGILSGIVEPISALLMYFIFSTINGLLPFMLSLAASIMIYVVINEIIPNTNKDNTNIGSIYFIIGFIIMMYLDILM